jgi:hypothetical protein
MIYKIAKLQIQKNLNKGDMTKKPDLTQTFQKLITLTKHILFFWNFSHIYSYMIYKIAKLQTQKNLNKGDMTKKPDLAQSFQKLITLTKHILFFWNFENRSNL